MIKQVRFHRNIAASSWPLTAMFPSGPLQQEALHLYRWSTHTTHTLPQRGLRHESDHEMNMTMKAKLPNRNTRRGTQRKKGKRRKNTNTNTNTNTPSPERANPERAREKKKRTDDGPTTDQRRGGGRKRLTQPTRREPKPT